jgi:hypothetical protein
MEFVERAGDEPGCNPAVRHDALAERREHEMSGHTCGSLAAAAVIGRAKQPVQGRTTEQADYSRAVGRRWVSSKKGEGAPTYAPR